MTLSQNIRRALVADCRYDFLTLGGAIKPPTGHSRETRQAVKQHLRKFGWSYVAAAKAVGFGGAGGFVSIEKTLNGRRFSPPLIQRLLALPRCTQPNPRAGFKNGGAR